MKKELSLRRIIEGVPVRLTAALDDRRINGVLLEVDETSGRARTITRLQEPAPGSSGLEE